MNVCCVLVTYGNRSRYFKKVVETLINFNQVNNVVIVDNGVSEQSIEELRILHQENRNIKILKPGYNTGSAKGFKIGIDYAIKTDSDYIWLLDDDNLPKEDALDNLILAMKKLGEMRKKKYALLSFRPDREVYKKAIEFNNPSAMLGAHNSFLGFHISEKFKSLFERSRHVLEIKNKSYGLVTVAPYGGLFFHKSLVRIIGLPDEKYFLYGDDFDYSYRITKNCDGIYLVIDSVVNDLEQSFHLKKESEKILSNRLMKTNSKDRIFYSVRNGIVFEQNFVSNRFLYIINAFLHISLTFIILLLNPKHLWKYKYYIKGIKASI
ncbi:MAG: glycosyl transferase family 2 [Flavobacteriaceae bacterium]|nr:glycosyl transferase family 2 [Flavobacteriaceae bacterium]MBD09354.1 glycosyl transferase family 2 [Flavobacteriaceae bacterium]|tara:strand:+ start:5905 stop:6870 length:966 start_codon:yes stop_codon:yes gene_type:complete